jgi:hypothetical protein
MQLHGSCAVKDSVHCPFHLAMFKVAAFFADDPEKWVPVSEKIMRKRKLAGSLHGS